MRPRPALSTAAIEPVAILVNTAEVTTPSPESNLDNNIAVETTTLQTDVPEPRLIDFRIRKVVQAEGGADVPSTVVIPAAIFDWSCTEGSSGFVTFTSAGLADGSRAATVAQILEGNTCTATERPQGDNWMVDQQTQEILIQGEVASLTFTNTYTATELDPMNGFIEFRKVVTQADPNNPEQTFSIDIRQNGVVIAGSSTVKAGDGPIGQGQLVGGTYTVNEINIPEGWTLEDISCETINNAPVSEIEAFTTGKTSLEINLVPSGDVLCTFTNTFTAPEPANEAPVITSYGGQENATDSLRSGPTSTFVENLAATDDTDSEGAGLNWSITGGADRTVLSIQAATGILVFNSAVDFANPKDANMDNVYEVQVTVTDSGGLTDVVNIAITVTAAP